MKVVSALIAANLIFSSLAGASPTDISSPSSDLFIQVTKSGELRKFELCSKSKGPSSCKTLGNREWYLVSELEYQRFNEKGEAAVSIVATAALCVVGYAVGLIGLAIIPGTLALSSTAINAVTVYSTLAGTSIAASGRFSLSRLGPVEQLKQQYLLRGEVINDESVIVKGADDMKMKQIAARLSLVLDKTAAGMN